MVGYYGTNRLHLNGEGAVLLGEKMVRRLKKIHSGKGPKGIYHIESGGAQISQQIALSKSNAGSIVKLKEF